MTSPSHPLPAWARALDAAAILALALATSVAVAGGFRARLGSARLSVTSSGRVLLVAAALLVLRHLLFRQDPLHRRVVDAWRRARQSPALRAAWPTFLASRLAVLAVGFFAVVILGYPPSAPPWRAYENEAANLLARWDTGWYIGIATVGYRGTAAPRQQQNIAFFPAYPMLMRIGVKLVGSPLLAGGLIALGAFLWALVYLFQLARDQMGGEESAAAALALLAAYPFALFYSAAYTESLFLLGLVAAFYHFQRGELTRAGAWGLLVGLTRPNGCFLSVPLAIVALEGWMRARDRAHRSAWRDLAARLASAAMPGVGMVMYSAFIYLLTGHALAWAQGHAAWGRTYRGIDSLVTERYAYIAEYGVYGYAASLPIDVLNGVAAVFVLALAWPVTRRFGLAYGAFLLVNLLPPLFAGGLLSIGRMTAVLFPVFLWLGERIPARHRPAWVAVFAMGQGFNAALFFTWRPLF